MLRSASAVPRIFWSVALRSKCFILCCSAIAEISEAEFIRSVLTEADCDLHLDVNNVYVNGINHAYDPVEFIRAMPTERIVYMHMAGHYKEAENLIIDTHGADIVDPGMVIAGAYLPYTWRCAHATGTRFQYSASS